MLKPFNQGNIKLRSSSFAILWKGNEIRLEGLLLYENNSTILLIFKLVNDLAKFQLILLLSDQRDENCKSSLILSLLVLIEQILIEHIKSFLKLVVLRAYSWLYLILVLGIWRSTKEYTRESEGC